MALAIVVGLVDGCPLPSVPDAPPALRGPVRTAKKVRRAAMTPFRPLGELLRLRQRWKLFPSADRDQFRLRVEVRDAAERDYRLVYRPQDDEHDLLADRLDYRRLRGAWNPGSRGKRTGYDPFVEWLAAELFALDPTVDRVRVRQEAIRLEPEAGRFVELGRHSDTRLERRPRPGGRR